MHISRKSLNFSDDELLAWRQENSRYYLIKIQLGNELENGSNNYLITWFKKKRKCKFNYRVAIFIYGPKLANNNAYN